MAGKHSTNFKKATVAEAITSIAGVIKDPQTGRFEYLPTKEEQKYFTNARYVCYSIDNDGFYVTYRGAKRKLTETKHYNTLLEALKAIK